MISINKKGPEFEGLTKDTIICLQDVVSDGIFNVLKEGGYSTIKSLENIDLLRLTELGKNVNSDCVKKLEELLVQNNITYTKGVEESCISLGLKMGVIYGVMCELGMRFDLSYPHYEKGEGKNKIGAEVSLKDLNGINLKNLFEKKYLQSDSMTELVNFLGTHNIYYIDAKGENQNKK